MPILTILALVAFIVAAVLCGLGNRHPTVNWGLAAGWLGLALLTLGQLPGVHP